MSKWTKLLIVAFLCRLSTKLSFVLLDMIEAFNFIMREPAFLICALFYWTKINTVINLSSATALIKFSMVSRTLFLIVGLLIVTFLDFKHFQIQMLLVRCISCLEKWHLITVFLNLITVTWKVLWRVLSFFTFRSRLKLQVSFWPLITFGSILIDQLYKNIFQTCHFRAFCLLYIVNLVEMCRNLLVWIFLLNNKWHCLVRFSFKGFNQR